ADSLFLLSTGTATTPSSSSPSSGSEREGVNSLGDLGPAQGRAPSQADEREEAPAPATPPPRRAGLGDVDVVVNQEEALEDKQNDEEIKGQESPSSSTWPSRRWGRSAGGNARGAGPGMAQDGAGRDDEVAEANPSRPSASPS